VKLNESAVLVLLWIRNVALPVLFVKIMHEIHSLGWMCNIMLPFSLISRYINNILYETLTSLCKI